MSTTAPHEDLQPMDSREAARGRRLALASLVMVAVNLPWLVVSWLVGSASMAVVGAEEGHLLTEYGRSGWLAWALMLVFMEIPSILGVTLGIRARHHGERNLSTLGVLVNALVGVGLVALSSAQVIF